MELGGFTVTDCFGREVTLDASNAQRHRGIHPEAASYLDLLPLVLRAPHEVWESARDGHYHYYRRTFPRVRLQTVWLQVVVVEFPAGVKVVSWWLSSEIHKRGRQLWPRRRRR